MKTKLLSRFLCALLSVLMLVCMIPAITVSAATDTAKHAETVKKYVATTYANEEERLATMTLMYSNGNYSLYVDELLGTVAYRKNATGEVLFTNPWDTTVLETHTDKDRNKILSQIHLKFSGGDGGDYNSYEDAILKDQMSIHSIKNGIRVEYAIGELSARTLVPQMIERSALEQKILKPISEKASGRDYAKFANYYNELFYVTYSDPDGGDYRPAYAESAAIEYPVTKSKGIDIYVLQYDINDKDLKEMEDLILRYCPDYTFEEMDNDHAFVEFEEEALSPPIFKVAVEYTVDELGLSVNVPANGIRFDETTYRISKLSVLPYMGTCTVGNEGYSFLPDGSGALFDINQSVAYSNRVYGEDYALSDSSMGLDHNQVIRMPVFGQMETIVTQAEGQEPVSTKRGFLGIIEEGESLATITADHDMNVSRYAHITLSFITRQTDTASSGGANKWSTYASRRYVDDYKIRYILLSDDAKAEAANLSSYYECSWMGMACAYRDYLSATNKDYQRLTDENVKEQIPLYIETFGCMDSIEKVLSMPVTVSVPLTTFEDITTMYDFLAGEGVENVNFKLKGYANGGLYSDVPYKLKWESSVGGKSGFKDLTEYAAEQGFGVYPDFDFVYTTQSDGGNKVNMKKNAARTIENRYTTRRAYSATKHTLVSYFQMVMSPETYSKFYENLGKRYGKYKNATGISLASFGNSLNSDFDENKTVLREESKEYVLEALSYFKNDCGDGKDIMLDAANAYTWGYADHILNVPLDSSRYNFELRTVPFMGVVLHGYVEFAGTSLNMEGNLSYAMLKAIENGASVYFVLSYANTQLLKEDELLSQNYSVRYDIWQNRLVEIYHELNDVLYDVQTKLIIDHRFLEGSRVPDEDEILADIIKDAADKAQQIEDKIDADHQAQIEKGYQAINTAAGAADKISKLSINVGDLDACREPGSNDVLMTRWKAALTDHSEGTISSLKNAFDGYIVAKYFQMKSNYTEAAKNLLAAKDACLYLETIGAAQPIQEKANADLALAKAAYLAFAEKYEGRTGASINLTDTQFDALETPDALIAATAFAGAETAVPADLEAFIRGTGYEADYTSLGAKKLYDAFKEQLRADGLYDLIDVNKLEESYTNGGSGGGNTEEDNTPTTEEEVFDQYAVDGDIVYVTYGEEGTPYKSVILNFNSYVVQTEVNGVTYTIGSYDYVVIYH